MAIQGRRTFWELRVGKSHSVEVLFHLRGADIEWFNSDYDNHFQEVLALLSDSIVPRMLGDEVDQDVLPKDPVSSIGEKNQKKKANKRRNKRRKAEGEEEEAKTDKPKEKDVYYAFGSSLQLAYRTEEISSKSSVTLIMSSVDSEKKSDSQFRSLKKLSKRIVMWCYQYDPNNPTKPDPEGGGFFRPEIIPIADLFREPLSDNEGDKKKNQKKKST